MILLLGASGKTGKAILGQLAQHKAAVRALIHRPEHASAMRSLGAAEVFTGDMQNNDDLARACQGVHSIYYICPNMNEREVEITRLVLQAAAAGGVERLVYHSVLHPQTEAMPHHWNKLRSEELIFQSGLNFTILQPTAYMQNIQAYWQQITRQGVYPLPYAPESLLSLVDLADVAQVAAKTLLEPTHTGAIYELVGTAPLSQHQVAESLSRVLGKPVKAEYTPRPAWEAVSRQAGLSEYAIQTLLKMFIYYEEYGLWGNPTVLTFLLNRQPTTLDQFLERIAK